MSHSPKRLPMVVMLATLAVVVLVPVATSAQTSDATPQAMDKVSTQAIGKYDAPRAALLKGPTQVVGGSFHDTETKPYTAEDFRFTTKGQDLFAIELGWPAGGRAIIHSLGKDALGAGRTIAEVTLLGSDSKFEREQAADGLHIQAGATPPGSYAYVFRIKMR